MMSSCIKNVLKVLKVRNMSRVVRNKKALRRMKLVSKKRKGVCILDYIGRCRRVDRALTRYFLLVKQKVSEDDVVFIRQTLI